MMRPPTEPSVRREELAAADVLVTTFLMTPTFGYHEWALLLDNKNAVAIYGNGIRGRRKS